MEEIHSTESNSHRRIKPVNDFKSNECREQYRIKCITESDKGINIESNVALLEYSNQIQIVLSNQIDYI